MPENTPQNTVESPKPLKEKPFLAANWVRFSMFLLIGLSIVVANFFLENHLIASGEEIVQEKFVKFDYSKSNILPERGLFRFEADNGPSMNVLSQDDLGYIFELNYGHFWGNFAISSAKTNILIGDVVVIPNGATFDLDYKDGKLKLAVYGGDVYLGFLAEGAELVELQDQYSDVFMNRLLVPRDSQVDFPVSKINQKIAPLLYTKLVKELNFSAIPSSDRDSAWVSGNLKKDVKFIASAKQDVSSQIISKGLSVEGSLVSKFVSWSEQNLTFIPEKRERMIFSQLFLYLDDALYYANQGDEAAMQDSLEKFRASGDSSIVNSVGYKEKLAGYLDVLGVYSPGDMEYQVRQFLLPMYENDPYILVNQYWLDVYEAIEASDLLAEQALDDYYQAFNLTLGDVQNAGLYKKYISYHNQLFDNLLLRYPVFYKDGYFAIKSVYEAELLKLAIDPQEKQELSQSFVSRKIDFLKRLRKFFFDEELEVQETKDIFKRLFGEIDALMPADGSGLAVTQLFESQLSDIDDFYGYLNTPEYQSKIYGSTHEERFQTYLKERDTIWNILNVKENIFGETDSSLTVGEIASEVETALSGNEDLKELEVGEIVDSTQRYIDVKGILGGYPFRAKFDRSTELLSEVYVYDELVGEEPIKFSNLLSVLQDKFADFVPSDEGDSELTEETVAQRIAREFVSKKVAEFGFVVTVENVKVVDELNAVYRVEGVTFTGASDVEVTFDILMGGDELVTNVYVVFQGQPIVLNGKYSLEELGNMVKAGDYQVDASEDLTELDGSDSSLDLAPVKISR